ncbi:MAG TPA: hypothetical protein VII94_01760, partial [Candidatus Saccharimonadales bacterium]
GAIGGATYGLAALAHEVVATDMGTTYDGYSQGVDAANQAAAGGVEFGSDIMRKEFFGVPLQPLQVAYNQNENNLALASENSHNSTYQRYLALSNPYSLLSRMSGTVYADITNFSLKSLVDKLGSILNPSKVVGLALSLFGNKSVSAEAAIAQMDNKNYGLVQWGYTAQEQQLISPTAGNPSYQPLENAKILYDPVNAQNLAYIKSTYGTCYTADMGTLLTQKPTSGPDSSDPAYIVRDTNGNVTGGLCTEEYLGPTSIDPQAQDEVKNKAGVETYGKDLIFRWRLAQSYSQSLDLLTGVQNAGS